MKMTISFDMDNEAFAYVQDPSEGRDVVAELDRIFGRISDSVWAGNQHGRIMDSNGNAVGRWEIES